MGEDQGRLSHLLDDLGHGECLARSGDPFENLFSVPFLYTLGQLGYGLGLVAGGLVGGNSLECTHG